MSTTCSTGPACHPCSSSGTRTAMAWSSSKNPPTAMRTQPPDRASRLTGRTAGNRCRPHDLTSSRPRNGKRPGTVCWSPRRKPPAFRTPLPLAAGAFRWSSSPTTTPSPGPAALAANGVTWVTVSDMPLAQIEAYKSRMGWSVPFVSSRGTSFSEDCGAGGGFMLSVFLRDGANVYRTYNTTSRGVDGLVFVNKILDVTPYGRQEDWEDSPAGWPQHPTYG